MTWSQGWSLFFSPIPREEVLVSIPPDRWKSLRHLSTVYLTEMTLLFPPLSMGGPQTYHHSILHLRRAWWSETLNQTQRVYGWRRYIGRKSPPLPSWRHWIAGFSTPRPLFDTVQMYLTVKEWRLQDRGSSGLWTPELHQKSKIKISWCFQMLSRVLIRGHLT